jgi:hypothetical protein
MLPKVFAECAFAFAMLWVSAGFAEALAADCYETEGPTSSYANRKARDCSGAIKPREGVVAPNASQSEAPASVLPSQNPARPQADLMDGLGLIYLYSKRCGSFESLPLKTQEALREGLSVARNAIINAAIKREEELKKSFSSGVMRGMIRQSFPSLL